MKKLRKKKLALLFTILMALGTVACAKETEDIKSFIEPTFDFDKSYPKVFQAWSDAENMEGFTDIEEMAAYDLIFDSVYAMGLEWKISEEQPYAALSTELMDTETWEDDFQKSIDYKQEILNLNHDFKILAEVHIREAYYVTNETIASGIPIWEYAGYPLDSEFWLLDEQGNHIPAWGEDSDANGIMEEDEAVTYLVDFTNEEYQDLIVEKVVALYESEVFDGVFFDWWSEEYQTLVNYDHTESFVPIDEEVAARVQLLEKIREQVPDEFLILVNSNYDMIPQSAPYVNGVYMECFKEIDDKGIHDTYIMKMEESLLWAEENLLEPRINCLEGWRDVSSYDADQSVRIQERMSEDNLKQMEMLTAMVLTLSDGHVLFSDNNAQPSEDHLHNYYPIWTVDLGNALGEGVKLDNHVYVREFENALVIYNGSKNSIEYEGYEVESYSGYFNIY